MTEEAIIIDETLVETGSVQAPAAGDTTPPTIIVVSPPSNILGRDSELVLRITDIGGIQRAAVFVTPRGRETEMIYEGVGSSMRTGYQGSRVDIADGFELTVTRNGGWFPPLRFELIAYDASGNEAV